MTNIPASPSNNSFFSYIWDNPVVNFVSSVGSYFWGNSAVSREPSISYAATDLAISPLAQTEPTKPRLEEEPKVPFIDEPEAPIEEVSTPTITETSSGISLMKIELPFIDEQTYTLTHEKALAVLEAKQQRLEHEKAQLEALEKNKLNSPADLHLYGSALKIHHAHLDEYTMLKDEEQSHSFQKLLGSAIRSVVLPSLSIDDNEKAMVTIQMMMVPFPGKPNYFAALVTVSAETRQIAGALWVEGTKGENAQIQVRRFLSNEEIKQSTSEALLEIFPNPIVVTYLQQGAK